jgi:hypothetical protein
MNRSHEPLFDPRLADWLEDDPHAAPDGALEVVLAAFPSIKQRRASRMPWRVPLMNAPLRLGLAAAALVIAAAGGLYLLAPGQRPAVPGASPTSSPAASPTAPITPSPTADATPAGPQMSTFTSPVHGYTIEHPAAYRALPATEAWPPSGFVGNEEPWVDRFVASPTGGVAFVGIASQPLPAGMSAEDWLAGYEASVATRGCPVPLGSWSDSTVGDSPGRRAEFACQELDALEVAWVFGDRGFVATGQPAVIDLMLPTIAYE